MMKISEMPKYDDYVDSGVEWLGRVPSHWQIIRLKNTINGCVNGLWGADPNGKDELVVVRVSDFDEQKLNVSDEKLTYRSIPENERKSRLLKFGDLLIEKSGGGDKTLVGRVVLFDKSYTAVTSNFVAKMTPKNWVNHSFLKYVFFSLYSRGVNYVSIKQTTGIQNLDANSYLNEVFCFPDEFVQAEVANFLDKKTAQIDEAISIKEQQISLLKERKQIIIQQAVTQGLDPNVPMKDSGVDWIGKIPAHWDVKRLKYLGKSIIGLTYSPNDLSDEKGGTLVARSSNLYEGKFKYGEKENVYVNCFIPEHLKLKKGDILICSRNGSRDLIGKCAFVSDADEGNSFGAFTTVFRSKHNEYLFCILNSDVFKMLSGTFLTSTINQLTVGNLNSIFVPFPPSKNERDGIITYINRLNGDVERAIEYQKIQIEKLKEYKTTLINSAVTGKIKITPEMVEQ